LVTRSVIEKGILVSNWGTTVSFQVAEHALLLILGALRSAGKWPSLLKDPAEWHSKERLYTRSLRYRRVGIHGFGSIARSLISLLRPFEAKCFVYSEGVSADFISAHGATPCGTLGELCVHSEIFVECEALTPATKGIITEHFLNLLPENSVFVNVARGALVDEDALARTAKARGLRLASDVFQIEPLPPGSPLRDCPDVFFSPHIGGPTHDSYTTCGDYALRNLERFMRGEPVEAMVTTEVYDRST
jgi:phosphoglycerate dehydrogenase-like enzyme